jgi:serine protease AprX
MQTSLKALFPLLAVLLATPAMASTTTSTTSASELTQTADRSVIVTARPGRSSDAQRSLAALGGTVEHVLPIIDGFVGTISADRIEALLRSDAVVGVTPDAQVTPMSVDPGLGYDPEATTSLSAISKMTGAQTMWNAGYVGQGVDVALIDTGVSRVPGLDQVGKVLNGPDLSFDSVEPTLVSLDAFGHGTHMAGIIAGSDVAPGTSARGCNTCTGTSAYTNTSKFVGIAPEARIINVKVGSYDGATDISQVIAGIDWVVQHRNDPGVNIRVLNLSFGTDSLLGATLDPLVQAADVAWKAGIVVVAAGGNEGLSTTSLASPALSPTIIAVGASDPGGTLRLNDDKVAEFALRGSAARPIDFVAPGVSVISLRVPGSFVDQNVTTGKVGTRFQQASGTSQSTAVASGLVALLISKYPSASPDMIKAFLAGSTEKLRVSTGTNKQQGKWAGGAGAVNVRAATSMQTLPQVPAAVSAATGLGSLERARGTYHVISGVTPLTGEFDIFGQPWSSSTMAPLTSQMSTWTNGVWNGSQWTGNTWANTGWIDSVWTQNDWTGGRWSGGRWNAMIWDGGRWSGGRWSGGRWSSGSWSGGRWSGARWSDNGWS